MDDRGSVLVCGPGNFNVGNEVEDSLGWCHPMADGGAQDPMLQPLAYLAALGLGIAFALYLPLNSLTARVVASPFLANVVFFAFGLATALVVAWIAGNRLSDVARFSDVPWWMYLSGVMSGLMILGSAFLIPQIGPGPFFVLFVAGQVVTGAFIGHFGWFRLTPDAATVSTFAGLFCVVLGAWLVTSR